MRLEALINKNYDLLTANDREIANTIFREKKAVREMNSTQLSSFLNISRTTLVRFMKKLGIATFAEFRLLLEEEQGSRNVMSFGMRDILNHYHAVIDELKKHDYSQVCRMIAGADTIYLYGSGNEQKAVAEEFKRIFLIFGKYCVDLFDFGEVEFARERFRENDLFVAISLSGESSEAIRVMRCVQGSEIRTLSLTRWANNSLARMCQENLYVGTRTVYQTERESYEMVDGYPTYTDWVMNNPDGWAVSQAMSAYIRGNYNGPFVQDIRYLEQYYTMDEQKETPQVWGDHNGKAHRLPPVTPTTEESTELASITNELNTYRDEMILKFIFGDESLDNFDEYVQNLENMGLSRALEIQNAALERYNAR